MELRLNHLQVFDKLNRKEALARIEREDGGRGRYLKRYFGKDINDPLQYHLVINTDWVTLRQAAAMVCELALNRHAPGSAMPAKAAA
jgi:cytidylate kinase